MTISFISSFLFVSSILYVAVCMNKIPDIRSTGIVDRHHSIKNDANVFIICLKFFPSSEDCFSRAKLQQFMDAEGKCRSNG